MMYDGMEYGAVHITPHSPRQSQPATKYSTVGVGVAYYRYCCRTVRIITAFNNNDDAKTNDLTNTKKVIKMQKKLRHLLNN